MSRVVLSLLALAMLAACGIKGDLERPDPLWNSEDAIRRECQRQVDNNEDLDPRCAQYQTGAQPQASTTPQHEVFADVEIVHEMAPPLPNRTASPEVVASSDAPTGQ